MSAPFIRSLLTQGGTFYGFSSAAVDMARNLNNGEIDIKFSKFALLDIPELGNLATDDEAGNIVDFTNNFEFNSEDNFTGQVDNLFQDFAGKYSSADNNIKLSESFQNYCLNFEHLLLDKMVFENGGYTFNNNKTFAERVFFKWLQNLGAIKFKRPEQGVVSLQAQNSTNIFSEYENGNITLSFNNEIGEPVLLNYGDYERVVKYIGDIDVVNLVSVGGDAYTEIYINVPTEAGALTDVLFKNTYDVGVYNGNEIIDANKFNVNSPLYQNGITFINKRFGQESHPDALFYKAISDRIEGKVDDNLQYKIRTELDDANFAKSIGYYEYLDGIGIDFNFNNYAISTDEQVNNIFDASKLPETTNFKFNTVLVYYDSIGQNGTKTTNLYGVLFLEDYKGGDKIQSFAKNKPNPVTGLNGNAYGLKLNVKFDNSIDNASVVTSVNDYNTFSMDLFFEASGLIVDSYYDAKNALDISYDNEVRLTDLEDKFDQFVTEAGLSSRVNDLEKRFVSTQLAADSLAEFRDLINQTNQRISNLIGGKLDLELAYDLGLITSGTGISVDTSVPNKVKIVNSNNGYKIPRFYIWDRTLANSKITNEVVGFDASGAFSEFDMSNVTIDLHCLLRPFTNYGKVYNDNTGSLRNTDLDVYISDKSVSWKEGQVFKLVFNKTLTLGLSTSINIYTDHFNIKGNGSLNSKIISIPSSSLINKDFYIDIVCINEDKLLFTYDILKR